MSLYDHKLKKYPSSHQKLNKLIFSIYNFIGRLANDDRMSHMSPVVSCLKHGRDQSRWEV